jgi:hypothetical protein
MPAACKGVARRWQTVAVRIRSINESWTASPRARQGGDNGA